MAKTRSVTPRHPTIEAQLWARFCRQVREDAGVRTVYQCQADGRPIPAEVGHRLGRRLHIRTHYRSQTGEYVARWQHPEFPDWISDDYAAGPSRHIARLQLIVEFIRDHPLCFTLPERALDWYFLLLGRELIAATETLCGRVDSQSAFWQGINDQRMELVNREHDGPGLTTIQVSELDNLQALWQLHLDINSPLISLDALPAMDL